MFERDSCSSGPLVGASADASEAVGGETARARSLWRAKQSVGVVGDRPSSGSSTTAVCSEAAFVGAPGDTGFFAVAALVSLSRFTGSVAPSSSAPRACAERRRVGSARLRDIRGGRGRGAAAFAASRALPRGTLRRVSASVERGGTFAARLGLGGVARRGARPSRRPASASLVSSARPIGEGRVVSKGSSRGARARATPKRVPPEGSSESFKNFKNRDTTRGSWRLVDVLNFASSDGVFFSRRERAASSFDADAVKRRKTP